MKGHPFPSAHLTLGYMTRHPAKMRPPEGGCTPASLHGRPIESTRAVVQVYMIKRKPGGGAWGSYEVRDITRGFEGTTWTPPPCLSNAPWP